MSKSLNKRLFRITILLVMIILSVILLSKAGVFLVVADQQTQRADATIILMGSIADRVLEAGDYYKNGQTQQFIIVNNIQYGSEALEPYGVFIPNFARLSIDALKQLGVPDSAIILLAGRAKSTRDEADTLVAKLRNHPEIKVVSVISSSPHTRRAMMIIKDSFNDNGVEADLIMIPSKYSEFTAKRWWTDRESAKQVFMEWTKIISFVTIEKWL